MTPQLDIESALSTEDPRVTAESIELVPRFDFLGEVLLVGVVHDHPASMARVGHILTIVTPDVLALELPSLSLPLFREYAGGDVPPSLGGEMSMALWATGSVRTEGIDAPSWGYIRHLGQRVLEGDLSGSTLRAVIADLGSASHQALMCGFGGIAGRLTGVVTQPYPSLEYDCSMMDTPEMQADHESSHIETQQAFLNAVEIPRDRVVIDEAREASMAARLHDLREDGTVVAIIGVHHLEQVGSRLEQLARQ